MNKIAMIVGASSGIGKACALRLARDGYDIFMVARREEKLVALQNEIKTNGATAAYYAGDIADVQCAGEAVQAATEIGQLHALVMCAGYGGIRSIGATSEAEYLKTIDINVMSVIRFCKAALAKMNADGSIVLLSSPAGIFGAHGMTGYSFCKGGLIAFAKSLALELAPKKIRVNTVVPGAVDTDFFRKMYKFFTPKQMHAMEISHPLGIGRPEDIANSINFLVSDEAAWITGAVMNVDGGFTIGI